jgi:HTH-type transcriptional repressor of NAD biosynthesis genes
VSQPSGGEQQRGGEGRTAEGSASDEAEPSGGEDERGQRNGLIVGRFCPPHLGHSHMIDAAARQVGRLVVMVNTRDGEPVPGDLRAAWLAGLHPSVTVIEVHHDLATDFDDEELWERWMALFRAHWPFENAPEVVFSSEPYGDEIARRFGATAIAVDPTRATVPISATLVRERPLEHLHFLAPPVRAWVEAQARGAASA